MENIEILGQNSLSCGANKEGCSFWSGEDVSPYGRAYYINFYYHLIVFLLSFLVLAFKQTQSYIKSKPVKLDDSETRPLAANPSSYGSTNGIDTIDDDELKSIKARHFDISKLENTKDDGSAHGQVIEVTKSHTERLRVSLEYLLLAIQVVFSGITFFIPQFKLEWTSNYLIHIVNFVFWGYLFSIATIRMINIKKMVVKLPSLWVHSTLLYCLHFFPAVILFRSALLGSITLYWPKVYYIVGFVINSVLVLLNLTATSGDKPSRLYVTNDKSQPSPETVSSILSFISYSWINKLVLSGYKKSISQDEIWSLREEDYALHILKGFESAKSTARFSVKVFTHFKFLFALQALYSVAESIVVFFPTILLKKVLEYVADPTIMSTNMAWTLVVLMSASKIVDTTLSGCSLFLGRRVCVRMRAIIIAQVYAKALRRKITVTQIDKDKDSKKDDESDKKDDDSKDEEKGGKATAELGAIINLMAIDAFKVSEVCGYLHFFLGAILMIFTCLFLLYQLIGWSALVGASIICCLLPVNYKLAIWLGNLQKKMLSITDKRIQKINETLQSIRIIKFFAWENKFFEQIMSIRTKELYELKLRSLSWCLASFVYFMTPTIITLVSFYCYTMIAGQTLTAPIAFTALSLFTLLRSPLDQLSDMTALVIQSKVSLDRVNDFLDEQETTKYDQLTNRPGPNSPTIGFENATFSWNKTDNSSFKLRDISINFQPGKLNVIFGPTGSGKTSLLLALLGEMDILEGNVFLPGIIPRDDLTIDPATGLTESVAYCAQSAWLLNDSIRNNIIFGSPFNQDRYNEVIDACGLVRDFEILSAGDSTEIGEKGITLSGGQKQRVSLARALYSNSKHVLLDDCLSAVDSHTALWIYENCISGPLMQNRTCILVSHNVALTVQNADWVIMVENGRVKKQDTPQVLLDSGDLGADDLVKNSVFSSKNQSSNDLTKVEKNNELKAKSKVVDKKLQDLKASKNDGNDEVQEANPKADNKLVEEESKAEGAVDAKIYIGFMKMFGGFWSWFCLISFYVFSQCVYIIQSWWLRKWSSDSESVANTVINSLGLTGLKTTIENSPATNNFMVHTFVETANAANEFKAHNSTMYYIVVYGIIGVAYSFLASLRVFYTFFAGITASNAIFIRVLQSVLNAKLRFFDKTPIGRIMNRFSKDIEDVDQDLTPFAEVTFICFIQCLTTLMLITAITPGFLIFAFFISGVYYIVGILYISVSREFKRYDSITKSPIHQHFSESLSGIATIRAYGVESRFMKQNLNRIDTNNKPFFYIWVANRWLCFRTEVIGALVMFFAGVFVLMSIDKIDAGLAGLSLSYAIAFSESALWIVRLYSNLEMNMNSVERLMEYFNIDQEPPHEIPETEPRPSWPENGEIDVKDVSLRYSPELPRVINNISFHVPPNNKVGIVGRTGAGKSTIITAFFRFLDPETGNILIDGVDICKIGLRNLRQAITIIPQDPTLFTGTIKSNLDPFDEYSDKQMFESLRRVNLVSSDELNNIGSTTTQETENQNQFLDLESPITEGGGNLSQGQRQLMCLARSLLRSPKVILLDEATASIDYDSDALIQQTIRDEFRSSTILTIAHRLRSIIDYDKILVMDAGEVVEYEDPYTLISNTDSLFYSMCANSGELDLLTKLAKEAYVTRKNNN